MTANHTPRWGELGRVVKARREAMRLPQDLSDRGGPGEITTRKVERGDGASAQRRTWSRLEAALSWKVGAVDRVLDGTATEEDLNPNQRAHHQCVDDLDEDLVGFYAAVLRRLGLDPLDWAAYDIGDVLAELDRRLAPRPTQQ